MSWDDLNLARRRWEREAVDIVLNDLVLREELDDGEAGRLFEWGLEVVERRVALTAGMDGVQARRMIEATLAGVKAIIRLAQEIIVEFHDLPSEREATDLILRFYAAVETIQPVPDSLRRHIPWAVTNRQRFGRIGSFSRVIETLQAAKDRPWESGD